LLVAANEAQIKPLEFAQDYECRMKNPQSDRETRATLQGVLDEIVRPSEAESR
jgi:hypothetical protein